MPMLLKHSRNRRFAFEQLERRNLLAGDWLVTSDPATSNPIVERVEVDKVVVGSAHTNRGVAVDVHEEIVIEVDDEHESEPVGSKPEFVIQPAVVTERFEFEDHKDFEPPEVRDTKAPVSAVPVVSSVINEPGIDDATSAAMVVASVPSPVSSPQTTSDATVSTPVAESMTAMNEAGTIDPEEVMLPRIDVENDSLADEANANQEEPPPEVITADFIATSAASTNETVANLSPVHELITTVAERVLPDAGPLSMASLSADFSAIDSAMSQLLDELDALSDQSGVPFGAASMVDLTLTSAVGLIAVEIVRRRKRGGGYRVLDGHSVDDDAVVWMFPEFSGMSEQGIV